MCSAKRDGAQTTKVEVQAVRDNGLPELMDQQLRDNSPRKPRHLWPHTLFDDSWKGAGPVTGRRLVLGNADVRIAYAVADTPSSLYRNAVSDECVYLEVGSGEVETIFGTLPVPAGDYVLLPRGTTHRWIPPVASGGVPIASRRTVTSARRIGICRSSGSCWRCSIAAGITRRVRGRASARVDLLASGRVFARPAAWGDERSIGVHYFDELAVTVDTFRPPQLGEGALACEDPGYAWTWAAGQSG
jgi:hypothetical protein